MPCTSRQPLGGPGSALLLNDSLLKYFCLQFLTSWTLHCVTVDVICEVLQFDKVGSPEGVPRSSDVNNRIESDHCSEPGVFLFLSVCLWWFPEGFGIREEQKVLPQPGLLVLQIQSHYDPSTCSATSCPGDIIINSFWRKT